MEQYQSIYNGSQIDDCVSQAVRTIVQQLTDAQKSQVRTNIGAGTYSIPSGGIPKTSLTTDVQTSLSKADNALPLSGGTVTGVTIFSRQGDIGATKEGEPALIVGGTQSQPHLEFDNNEIVAKANATTPDGLYIQWDGGDVYMTGANGGNTYVGTEYLTYPNKFNVGGTAGITGTLYVTDIRSNPNNSYTANQEYGLLTCCPQDWGGVNSNEWAVGSDSFNGVIRAASTLYIYRNGSRYTNIDNAGGTIYGRVVIDLDNDAEANDYNSGSLRIGTASGNHLLLDGNEIIAANGNSAGTLHLQYNGGDIVTGSEKFGIGTGSPSYKLHVAGSVGATGFTNTSDVRKKNIIEDINLDINRIANAPIFKFTWLDKNFGQDVNVGTSAQYWKTILPEIVSEANDFDRTLSMQYDVAGLVSSVILARKIVEQEETIKLQDTRIKELEKIVDDIQKELDK